MRIAIAMSGQARVWRAYPNLLGYLVQANSADVYVSTWDEPPYSDKILAAFEPKAHSLHDPASFVDIKRDFWTRYSSLLTSDKEKARRLDFLNGRWYYKTDEDNYQVIHADNCLRQYFLMRQVIKLVDTSKYDLIVRARPDGKLKSRTILSPIGSNEIGCPSDHHHEHPNNVHKSVCSDQLFYGHPAIMSKVMSFWDAMPKHVYEVEDLLHPPYSLGWLTSEPMLLRYIKRLGATVKSMDIQSGIVRGTAATNDKFWPREANRGAITLI
jgi:hypothetical protein